jgi:hypothetical protein
VKLNGFNGGLISPVNTLQGFGFSAGGGRGRRLINGNARGKCSQGYEKEGIKRYVHAFYQEMPNGRTIIFVSKETFSRGNSQGFAENIRRTIPTFGNMTVSNTQNGDNTD